MTSKLLYNFYAVLWLVFLLCVENGGVILAWGNHARLKSEGFASAPFSILVHYNYFYTFYYGRL